MLALLLDVCRESRGAFDITIAPLSLLWNFDEDPSLPSVEDILYFQQYVGYENVSLNQGGRRAHLDLEECAVDLGAAGKGAACDAAMEAYKEYNVTHAVIAVGGSVGPNRDGALGVLHLVGGFISTSGSYEKYFEENGVMYHHILDPETGYPAESGLVSVTIVADSGALSDALSTACFVLGYEESLSLLEHYGAEAVFVTEQNEIFVTEGLTERFELSAAGYSLVSGHA